MAIKKNLKNQYQEFLQNNKEIEPPVLKSIQYLNDSKTPMQIEDALYDFSLNPYQTSRIANAIVKFHERGEEFKAYWIKRNNVSDEINLEEEVVGFPISKRKEKRK